MYEEMIKKAGLTANETKVYTALMAQGASLAGEITKKTGIHRRNVYDSIERLIEKGLVGYVTVNRRRFYKAVDPKRLLLVLDEEEQNVDKRRKELERIMPNLTQIFDRPQRRLDVEIFEGKEGVKTIFTDVVGAGQDYYLSGARGEFLTVMPYFYKEFVRQRKSMGIKANLIFTEESRGRKEIKAAKANIRFLPSEYTSPMIQLVYGSKIAMILWDRERPMGVLIDNREMAAAHRKYFEILWKIARK